MSHHATGYWISDGKYSTNSVRGYSLQFIQFMENLKDAPESNSQSIHPLNKEDIKRISVKIRPMTKNQTLVTVIAPDEVWEKGKIAHSQQ